MKSVQLNSVWMHVCEDVCFLVYACVCVCVCVCVFTSPLRHEQEVSQGQFSISCLY